MARGVSFKDAVRLLDDGRGAADRLDRLVGGALLVATAGGSELAASLFDPQGEMSKLTRRLTSGVSDRIRGLSRFQRTERLAAAHAVIVVSSYFEALSDLRLPVDLSKALRDDQARLAGAETSRRLAVLGRNMLRVDLPIPSPECPYEETLREVRQYYGALTVNVTVFLTGLAEWDALDDTERNRLATRTADAALARYEESFHRLATELPEFAYWTNALNHRATRHALTRLETLVREVSAGRVPDERRAGLALSHQAELARPILATGDVPEGITIPSLADAYVTPAFRAAPVESAVDLSSEDWWQGYPSRNDLDDFLAGHLTSLGATRAPLLVLGQPGSGKSVLTKILAARLPAEEFLVVRVVLREVPADAGLQTQIEYAIREATGEPLSWPDLARSQGDALPVVILDGFDELLQATGVSQTDYLENAAKFQERERTMGRPVVVIVTTRTAVADRARTAPGTIAVRLESFDRPQVERWLEIWNSVNSEVFAARGLRLLPVEAAIAHPDLASQPLLLTMLALYDADDNALQGDAGGLEQVELYERLLRRFAQREVRKAGAGLPDDEVEHAVEQELTRLSVVAFAMFNRARQWVTVEELDRDLAALHIDSPVASGQAGDLRAELSHGERAVGRFFFVHQSSATRDGRRLGTYEFLHATFSEYLVARLVALELSEVADVLSVRRSRTVDVDESFLRALLSFQPLTVRANTLDLLRGLMRQWDDSRRRSLRDPLIRLFKQAMNQARSSEYADYSPTTMTVPGRHASWSCNVMLVLLCVSEQERNSDLVEPLYADDDKIWPWRDFSMFWRARLPPEGWNALVKAVSFERIFTEGRRDAILRLGPRAAPLFTPAWSHDRELADRRVVATHRPFEVMAHANLIADRRVDVLAHALEPLAEHIPEALVSVYSRDGVAYSAAHSLIRLWLESANVSGSELVQLYDDCLTFTRRGPDDMVQLVFRQAVVDRHRLPRGWLVSRVELYLQEGDPLVTLLVE